MGGREVYPIRPLAGGFNNKRNPVLLQNGESPDALNIEHDRDSVQSALGSLRFGERSAPATGLRTRPDPGRSALHAAISSDSTSYLSSVPVRGYGYLPWRDEHDIGGELLPNGATPGGQTFSRQVGRDFSFSVTFQVPEEERLYRSPVRGAEYLASVSEINSFDESLDECFCIIQKGGDKLQTMSWALAVVNVGDYDEELPTNDGPISPYERQRNAYGESLSARVRRASNYALCFMWFDSAAHAAGGSDDMLYRLDNGGAVNQRQTQAYRALLADTWIEPGKTYEVVCQLQRDSGTAGTGVTPTPAWNNDGFFELIVKQPGGSATVHTYRGSALSSPGFSNLYTWRGPTDSADYLSKYGIRFWGKDPMYLGLGMRFLPWADAGFIPLGQDASPLEHGGYQMLDRSSVTHTDLYGGAALTVTRGSSANQYFSVPRGLVDGTDINLHPTGPEETSLWEGLGGNTGAGTATNFNPEALKGYKLVLAKVSTLALRGSIHVIDDYLEAGSGDYRLGISGNHLFAASPGDEAFICCFRWRQRDLVIQDVRFYSSVLDFTDERRLLELDMIPDLEDEGFSDRASLSGLWALDDAGDGVLHERVLGNHGYIAPFAVPLAEGAARGPRKLFLSGEGEALQLDFSEDPIFQEQFLSALQDPGAGAAIEITVEFTEAFYGIASVVGSNLVARFAPRIASWEVKDAGSQGFASQPKPFIRLTSRQKWPSGTLWPAYRPLGFSMELASGSDQDADFNDQVSGHYKSTTESHMGFEGDWVGRTVTIQFGLHPDPATPDTYDAYIAISPKSAIENDDVGSASSEFQIVESKAVPRKDIARSVINIGGMLNPGEVIGYTETNCRMVVHEVRVFGTTAPGARPVDESSPSLLEGKIIGSDPYPQRELSAADIFDELGPGKVTANLTRASATVLPSGSGQFAREDPALSRRSVNKAYLQVAGDKDRRPEKETSPVELDRYYYVEDVASDGSSATLSALYQGSTKAAASARVFRLIGYTAFSDDTFGKALVLGEGASSDPKSEDFGATDTPAFFANLAPTSPDWNFRVFSPVVSASPLQFQPQWVRGLKPRMHGEVLGLHPLNSEVYKAVQGALYQADDRWREDGPNETFERSIEFRHRIGDDGTVLPLHEDWIEFEDVLNVNWTDSTSAVSNQAWAIDSWLWLERRGEIQTVAQLVDIDSQTTAVVGGTSADARKAVWWVRINDGVPELVLGATKAGSPATPVNSEFIASASVALPVREWVHLRVLIPFSSAATPVASPAVFFVNGQWVGASVNAVQTGLATGEWIEHDHLELNGANSNMRLYLGAARQFVDKPTNRRAFALEEAGSDYILPTMRSGMIHGLAGRMCGFAIWRANRTATNWPGSPGTALVTVGGSGVVNDASSFDPNAIEYSATHETRLVATLQEGRGAARVARTVNNSTGGSALTTPGVIWSHPDISIYHEMGSKPERTSHAVFGNELYVANGRRPIVVERGVARVAGLSAPSAGPSFAIERSPLWRFAEDRSAAGFAGSPDGDPFSGYVDKEQSDRRYVLDTRGFASLVQSFHPDMVWEQGSWFGFKGYFRMRSIAGRIPIYSARRSLASGGPFLEIRDGYVYFGWWDTGLKEEVFVRTSVPVVETGYWYYINVRKRYPHQDYDYPGATNSNWGPSIYRGGWRGRTFGGSHEDEDFDGDQMIVRRIPKKDLPGSPSFNDFDNSWEAKKALDAANAQEFINDVPCVSFPPSDFSGLSGATATGRVTIYDSGTPFVGSGSGQVTFNLTSSTNGMRGTPFCRDMIGMYWQWSGGADSGTLYRIVDVDVVSNPALPRITVEDTDGNKPNFSSYSGGGLGAVYCGVSLIKSDNFDASAQPDNGEYAVEVMGSALSANPLNGVSLFDGEMSSFAFGVTAGITMADFAGEVASTGTAWFNGANGFWNATNPNYSKPGIAVDSLFGVPARPLEKVNPLTTLGSDGSTFGADHLTAFPKDNDDDTSLVVSLPPDTTTWDGVTEPPAPAFFYTSAISQWFGTAPSPVATSAPNEDLKIDVVGGSPLGKTAATAANAVSENTIPMFWIGRFLSEFGGSGGRSVLVTFYDPVNADESAPSPELIIEPALEDASNPSGFERLLLSRLPVSADGEQLQRRIYLSLAGTKTFFLVTTVPDNSTRSIAVDVLESEIPAGSPLPLSAEGDILLGAPPRCFIVSKSQNLLFYGRLVGQEDGYAYSLPFQPTRVPPTHVFPLDTGESQAITGMQDLLGKLVIAKRNAMASVVVQQGALGEFRPFERFISTGEGIVSQQSIQAVGDRFYFISDRGPGVMVGTGLPIYLGRRIEDYFVDGIDKDWVTRISACINRARNQYVFVTKDRDRDFPDRRWALEFDDELAGSGVGTKLVAGHRVSRYEGPILTALCSVDDGDRGVQLMVGGSYDGQTVWMDYPDQRSHFIGSEATLFGDKVLTYASSGSTTTLFQVGAISAWLASAINFDGPKGIVVRWIKGGEEKQSVVMGVSAGALHLDRPVPSADLPDNGATLTLGQMLFRWSTKDLDMGLPYLRKMVEYLNVTRRPTSGTLRAEIYLDQNMAEPCGFRDIDLTKVQENELYGEFSKEAYYYRFLFRTRTPVAGTDTATDFTDFDFELLDIAAAFDPLDNR